MMRAFKIILCFLLVLTSSPITLFAGTTGKISGKVVALETGEALIGANVVIQGTNLGAATDADGEYYIINIPPGTYSIKVSMIGYTSQIIEKVRVQVDLTTNLDIELNSESILTQEITITAKNQIQKDLTSSERSVQSDQITQLPVRDVTSILSMQAGITKGENGELHIRGGRSSEISYMVDGIQVMNPINRSSGISIDDQSIEELKAITGTFNAEYGQALSGVVNIVTKKGSSKFSMNVTSYIGDHFSMDEDLYSLMDNGEWARFAANSFVGRSNPFEFDFSKYGYKSYDDLMNAINNGDKPWQTRSAYLNEYDPVNHYDFQMNASGPIPGSSQMLSYYAAGRYQHHPGYQSGIRYFMPWGLWQPVSDTINSFTMPDGAIVPLDWYDGKSAQGKLFFITGPLSLDYGIYYNNDHSYSGGQKYLPDGGRNYYTDRYIQMVTATYVFSGSTFLDLKGSYYYNNHKNYLYEDPLDYRYVPTNTGDFQQWIFRPARGSNIIVTPNPNDFSFWGNDVGRSKNLNKYFSFSADLTSQFDKYNMVKFGASGRLHNVEQDYYSLQFSQVNYRPLIPDKSSPYHTYYTAKPKEFAAYIQDKIEFEELIINLGVRFDYFSSDGRILADPADPQIYSPFKMDHIYRNFIEGTPQEELIPYTVAERAAFWYKKADSKYQVSPRFGLSFPITADGVIHFSYGHFFQNPEFQYLYTNPNFWIVGAGSQNLVGNANLNAERTIMYEIGLQQRLFNNLFFHITGFYRDIRDWIGTGFPIDTYRGQTYYSFVNRDNAVAKGVTVSTSFKVSDFSFNADYTLMSANGSSSDPRDSYNDLSAGRAPRIQMINLDWDQPHSFNLIVNYNKESWLATLIGTVKSGLPYTPEFTRGEATGSGASAGLRENSERRPATINFDLRFSKTFSFSGIDLQAILDITNLLDTRNASYVYADTGLPDYTIEEYLNRSRLIEISSSNEYFSNPGRYSAPRFIQLGLRLSYN